MSVAPKPSLWSTEIVRLALAQAETAVQVRVNEELQSWCDEYADYIDSPIEAAFGIWWQAATIVHRLAGTCNVVIAHETPKDADKILWLYPQEELHIEDQTYRLDFSVCCTDPSPLDDIKKYGLDIRWPKIAVELDGHEFHERSREQVAYRNKRDRDLQIAGWKIFHFSGSEIYQNGFDSAQRVLEYAHSAWNTFWRDVKLAAREKGLTP